MLATRCLVGAALLVSGCGGRASIPADRGGGDGGWSTDGDGGEGTLDGSSEQDAISTGVCALGDFAVCGGANACPSSGPQCQTCLTGASSDPSDLGVCLNAGDAGATIGEDFNYGGMLCPDGLVVAAVPVSEVSMGAFECVPFQIGQLYGANGSAASVRYADYGLFTGAPLPIPSGCPDASGVHICGGTCPSCPAGSVCTGRSANHPWSFCVPEQVGGGFPIAGATPDGKLTCAQGYGCFRFSTEPEAVEVATSHAYCLPVSDCQAAAANLPGGGTCVIPAPNAACFP